jgi:signal transduction histidine kinase
MLSAVIAGCWTDRLEPDERLFPQRLILQKTFAAPVTPADLNGDAEDELLQFYTFNAPPRFPSYPQHDAVQLLRQSGEAIDQLNYQGAVLPPRAMDLDGDGASEILVPFVRHDSLHLSVADAQGRKRSSFLLAVGQSMIDIDSRLPWRPEIMSMYKADVDGDSTSELVTVLNGGGKGPVPRAILLHDLSGRLLSRAIIGADLRSSVLGDFDTDGRLELITAGYTPNNGATAGGFDDRHSYLIGFRLSPVVEVAWSRRMGEIGSRVFLVDGDFDGDGRREFVALTTPSNSGGLASLEWIEPGTWRTLRRRTWPERLSGMVARDITGDGRPDIVLANKNIDGGGELWMMSDSFEVARREPLGAPDVFGLGGVPDIDGDGIDEILVYAPHQLIVVGRNLRLRAARRDSVMPLVSWLPAVVRRGSGAPPDLLVNRGPGYAQLRLIPNPFAWFWRWGRWLLVALGILALFAGFFASGRAHRRARLLQTIHALVVDSAQSGLLLVRRDGRVEWVNAVFRVWLGLPSHARIRNTPLDGIMAVAPEARAFCIEALASDPPRHRQTEGAFRLATNVRELRISSEPLNASRFGQLYYLIRMEDRTGEVELREARAWSLVAQRVAHDFRKPLSGIVQELHRLQTQYRRNVSFAHLDPYVEDIEGRVLALRARADELLQVLGGEEPRFEETDLNDFVRHAASQLRGRLPGDVRLELHLADDAPLVRLDRRLMESVVSNLVTNSIDAMPHGGTITISTNLVRNARMNSGNGPRDYGRLEVLDDGEGLTEEVRRRLFEPGFTTREGGWGLGLAGTRRIVQNHDGVIEVHSEVGRGTAFIAYLPALRIAQNVLRQSGS